MEKTLRVIAGVLLVSLLTCLTGVALAANEGRTIAASDSETLVIPTVSDSQDANQYGVQPWNKQNRSKRVSASRKARSDSATATNVADAGDAGAQRLPGDDHWIGQTALPFLAGTMAIGGIALVIVSLRNRPSARRDLKHAYMGIPVQNVEPGTQWGTLVPAKVSFALANDQKVARSLPGIHDDAPDTTELRKAA